MIVQNVTNYTKYCLSAFVLTMSVVCSMATAHVSGSGGDLQPNDPTSPELTVVGRYQINEADRASDVWAHGNFAYIGSYVGSSNGEPLCSLDSTGVSVIDISDPAHPTLAARIPAKPGMRNNAVNVGSINTKHFQGDILVVSDELCGVSWKARLDSNGGMGVITDAQGGGINIYDVTDPTKPKALKKNYDLGIHTSDPLVKELFGTNNLLGVHNMFLWNQGDKAYLMAVADFEEASGDAVIIDITNPKSPKQVSRSGYNDWPDLQPEGVGGFLHDMWIQENDGKIIAYLSYWDAGLVMLDVTDPEHPVFMGNSIYPNPDPVSGLRPDRAGHVSVPTEDGKLVLLGDEDFSQSQLDFLYDGTQYPAAEAAFGPPIFTVPGNMMTGVVYDTGSNGCSASDVPDAPGPGYIALIDRGGCFFDFKGENAEQKGYDGFIVVNRFGEDVFGMGSGRNISVSIPGLMVGKTTGEIIRASASSVEKLAASATALYNGYGYMRVLDVTDPTNIVQVGHYATENVFTDFVNTLPVEGAEIQDAAVTIHNVVTRNRIAYAAWYDEGMRVIDFSDCVDGGGYESCTPHEIAHYRDKDSKASFWGVYLHDHPNGKTYIIGSDISNGLVIFEDPASTPLVPHDHEH